MLCMLVKNAVEFCKLSMYSQMQYPILLIDPLSMAANVACLVSITLEVSHTINRTAKPSRTRVKTSKKSLKG